MTIGTKDTLFFVRSLLVVNYLHTGGDGEGDEAEGHDEPEEVLVADVLGDETRDHAWEHHTTKVLTCRADGEDGCGAFATREGDEVEGVGSKAETIAYLLNADAGADEPEVVGGEIAEIDIHDVGQCDAEHEWPEALLQTPLRHSPSTDDATQQQANDTKGAVDESEIHVAQPCCE